MGKERPKQNTTVNTVAETVKTCVFTSRKAKWVYAWSGEQNSYTTVAIVWFITEYTAL
jgi:hypothetical protein